MRYRLIAAGVALLVGWAANSIAAEGGTENAQKNSQPESSQETTTESSGENRQDNAPAPKRTAKSDPSKEIFRPSEEISEDFAVSFPVDI
jgi:hypothetical protein